MKTRIAKHSIFAHLRRTREECGFDAGALTEPAESGSLIGSTERIAEYRRRLEAGENIFCDGDNCEMVSPIAQIERRRLCVEQLGFDRWSRPTSHRGEA